MSREVLDALWRVSLQSLPLLLSLAVFVDIARWDSWVWAMAERRRVVWMAMVGFGVLVNIFGLVVCSGYLVWVRPKLRRIDRGDVTPA